MSNYVAIYRDERENPPCRINPPVCGGHPGDTIKFANHMDELVELHFPKWPFEPGQQSPVPIASQSTILLTLAKSVKPGGVFPYVAKCNEAKEEARGSMPIIIIYHP
jgi:hypothetical protein